MILNRKELKKFVKESQYVDNFVTPEYDKYGNYICTHVFKYTDGNFYAVDFLNKKFISSIRNVDEFDIREVEFKEITTFEWIFKK